MDDQAWQSVMAAIDSRGVRIVSVDLPTSHQGITAQSGDEFTDRMLAAINDMMIDMVATIARKDYQCVKRWVLPKRSLQACTRAGLWTSCCVNECASC
jgi:hypothetical protein